MTYVTEKEGKYYIKNKTLFWTGRILALLFILFQIISNISSSSLFTDKTEFSLFDVCFSAIILIIECVIAFPLLLIGSRISIISEEGIDTYRDMLGLKMFKKHIDPCTYTLNIYESSGIGNKTTDISFRGENRTITLISFYILGSVDEAEKQIDEALSHFVLFTRKGLTAEYGDIRRPKFNGDEMKTTGKFQNCGRQNTEESTTKSDFPDFPTIINIGKYCKGISDCFYDLKVNRTKYLKEDKVKVNLHTNGIGIEQGKNHLYISFEQLIEMKCTINSDPESKYEYSLCIEYYDVYKHAKQTQVIGCKKEWTDFVERCMKEKEKHNLPEMSEYITCNLLDENGEFSKGKASEALKVINRYLLVKELQNLDCLPDNPFDIVKELVINSGEEPKVKKGFKYYLAMTVGIIIIILGGFYFLVKFIAFFI